MVKLPVLSGDELIKLLKMAGFQVVRQKGSHVSLQKANHKTVVPLHDELVSRTEDGMTGDNRSDLGRILKQRRVMLPLTLGELAASADVSSSHLGRIERGERYPSARILRRLARPLNFEEAELMSLAGYLSPEPTTALKNSGCMHLDPYVSMVLSQEPEEVQRAVVVVLTVLKSMARSLLPGSDGKSEVKNE